jgi:hypothetical protein
MPVNNDLGSDPIHNENLCSSPEVARSRYLKYWKSFIASVVLDKPAGGQ